LIVVPVQGFTNGVQPIISYNYGAGNISRVKGTFVRMLCVGLAGTILLAGSVVLSPRMFAVLFSSNEELISLTCRYMPVYFFGIIIFGIQMSCQLGQAKVSLFIALLRKVVLLIPLAVILPKFMGVAGIYRAEPVADILSVTVTSILFIHTARRLFRKE
jgi:Na+-driven multidrug efflux pump